MRGPKASSKENKQIRQDRPRQTKIPVVYDGLFPGIAWQLKSGTCDDADLRRR